MSEVIKFMRRARDYLRNYGFFGKMYEKQWLTHLEMLTQKTSLEKKEYIVGLFLGSPFFVLLYNSLQVFPS